MSEFQLSREWFNLTKIVIKCLFKYFSQLKTTIHIKHQISLNNIVISHPPTDITPFTFLKTTSLYNM